MDNESAKQLDSCLEALSKQFYNDPGNQTRALELMQRELYPVVHQRLADLRSELNQVKADMAGFRSAAQLDLERHRRFSDLTIQLAQSGELVDSEAILTEALICALLKEEVKLVPSRSAMEHYDT